MSSKRLRFHLWALAAALLLTGALYLVWVQFDGETARRGSESEGSRTTSQQDGLPPSGAAAVSPEAEASLEPQGGLPPSGGDTAPGSKGPASNEATEPAEELAISLVVRLVEETSGEPLAAESAAVRLRAPGAAVSRNVTTDEEGRFLLRGLAEGVYSMTVRHVDYVVDVRTVQVKSESPCPEGVVPSGHWDVQVPLLTGEWLEGEVVDLEGQPVPQAMLRLSLVEGKALASATATSADDGSFLVRGLREGLWRLTLGREGYRRKTFQVEIPAEDKLRIELTVDTGAQVQVLDPQGRPVIGARVALLLRTDGVPAGRKSGATTAEGKVRLFGLNEDAKQKVMLQVKHPNYLPLRETLSVAELSEAICILTLSRGVNVSGKVVDETAGPVANAEVVLKERDGDFRRVLRTVISGEFIFRKVPPGSYEIEVVTRTQGVGRLPELEIASAKNVSRLEVILESGEGTLAGRVLSQEGAPVPLCHVEVAVQGRTGDPGAAETGGNARPSGFTLRTVTGADGVFRFTGLPSTSGTPCRLAAWGRRLSGVKNVSAAVGQEEIILHVERTGSIRCLIAGEGPPESFTVILTPEEDPPSVTGERRFHFTSQDRWFLLEDVSPGKYTISILVGTETRGSAEGVEVLPGAETGPVKLVRKQGT